MTHRKDNLNEFLTKIDGASPKLGIAKHKKMASSPFLFFRGSAQLFYQDILENQLQIPATLYQVPLTTIVGDCHTSNFGFLTEEGSHGDNVVFTVNDFDDACFGHAIWDLARFITSLFLCHYHCAGVSNGTITNGRVDKGKPYITVENAKQAAKLFLQSYSKYCQQGVTDNKFRYQVITAFEDNTLLNKRYNKAKDRAACGGKFFTESTLGKSIIFEDKELRFKNLPEKFQPLTPIEIDDIKQTFAPYVDDYIHDIVKRLNAGTGSVNLERYYLLVGPTQVSKDELAYCHIVEIKQQRKAAPLYTYSDLSPVNKLNPAHLTVRCQQRMQRSPDIVLDEIEWRNAHWLVRSRHHAKVGIKPEHIAMGKKASQQNIFSSYAQYCGKALALAHCRGDRRSTLFEQSICQLLPQYFDEIIDNCQLYVQQVISDTQYLFELIDD